MRCTSSSSTSLGIAQPCIDACSVPDSEATPLTNQHQAPEARALFAAPAISACFDVHDAVLVRKPDFTHSEHMAMARLDRCSQSRRPSLKQSSTCPSERASHTKPRGTEARNLHIELKCVPMCQCVNLKIQTAAMLMGRNNLKYNILSLEPIISA